VPAPGTETPDPESEAKRQRTKKAAGDLADAALNTQYSRMPGWLAGFVRLFRK
jgi:hypothetical protein